MTLQAAYNKNDVESTGLNEKKQSLSVPSSPKKVCFEVNDESTIRVVPAPASTMSIVNRKRSFSNPSQMLPEFPMITHKDDLLTNLMKTNASGNPSMAFAGVHLLNALEIQTATPSPHSQDNRSVYEKSLLDKKGCSPFMLKPHIFDRVQGKIGKGGVCVEYADQGTGDFRTPSFTVLDNFNGSTISPLRYRKHKIYRGKMPMPDHMPSIRCRSEFEASTLLITMVDAASGLEVDLIYGNQ